MCKLGFTADECNFMPTLNPKAQSLNPKAKTLDPKA